MSNDDRVAVDLRAYASTVETQRNAAFNEAAMYATALDASREENAALRAENEALKAKLPPEEPPAVNEQTRPA